MRPAVHCAVPLLLLLGLAGCQASPSVGPAAAALDPVHGFPPSPPNCENPTTCGFACGPCASCPEEGAEIARRQQGFGLIDLQVQSTQGEAPVPHAVVSVTLEQPAAADGGVRPGPPGGNSAQQPRPSRQVLTGADGRARVVLRRGWWRGSVGRAGGYPDTPIRFEVTACLRPVVLHARPLSAGDLPPELMAKGVSCDLRTLTCRQAGLACPPGFAADVEGGCYNQCVPLGACRCTEGAACPGGACDQVHGRCREK